MITPRVANGVIIAVTIVWVISFGVTVVVPGYRADPQIHMIFMGIVGGSIALRAKRKPEEPPQ